MAISNASWCNGSTPHFDCDSMGSNPVGAVKENKQKGKLCLLILKSSKELDIARKEV